MDLLFSIIAIILSVVSMVITFYIYIETKRISRYQLNLQLIFESEKLLREFDELLVLHDIDTNELKADGISKDEFYYILTSFRSSESYYIINNRKDPISRFRANFLKNTKVELVYKKYLKDKLIATPIFVQLIDDFYVSCDN